MLDRASFSKYYHNNRFLIINIFVIMKLVIYMIIDLNAINIHDIEINEEVKKDGDLDKRILDLVNAHVKGRVYLDVEDDITLDVIFKGTMYIEDAITLDSVPYDFEISINENINELMENHEECYDKIQNTLDLKKILWQNIVLEVPISYTKEKDAELKGNGWELVNEEKRVKEIDPRLKKLEELLERRG